MALIKKQAVIVREKSYRIFGWRAAGRLCTIHRQQAQTTSSIPCSRSCGEIRNTANGVTTAGMRRRRRTQRGKDDAAHPSIPESSLPLYWRWQQGPTSSTGSRFPETNLPSSHFDPVRRTYSSASSGSTPHFFSQRRTWSTPRFCPGSTSYAAKRIGASRQAGSLVTTDPRKRSELFLVVGEVHPHPRTHRFRRRPPFG